MATLFELKERLSLVGQELSAVTDELMAKAADPSVEIEKISALKEKKANLQERFNLIKEEHDRLEAEQKANLQRNALRNGIAAAADDKQRLIAAKAAFYRAVIMKQPVPQEAASLLGAQAGTMIALPAAGGTGGEYLLPTQLTTELVHEPWVKNPLRPAIRISNISGLEVPKIAFAIDDDSFIGDADTAAELSATGSRVTFGRFKTKVKVAISDTVIHGSDANLVETIENALRSGLAAKEKTVSFAAVEDQETGAEHMSFYQDSAAPGTPAITEVGGADMYEAITNAIADLHEDFRENASVCMSYADYVSILKDLANSSKDLFGAPPERVIGKPVIFSDSATTPIVGDFSYLRLNYDGTPIYDTDKDVDAGEYLFVLTAWFDQHRLLNSAFRLAVVTEGEGE